MKINILFTALAFIVSSFVPMLAQHYTEISIVPDNEYVDEVPDKQPEYPGGINALMRFLSQNLVYPQEAMANNLQDKVIVKFIVNTKGDVEYPEIMSGKYPVLNQEALRVVSLLKGFKPGEKNGEAVKTWFTLPINFKLNSEQDEDDDYFDAVPIDSIGYQEMMDLGLKAQSENNLPHATAYFKEAFHINPYSIGPLERIVKMNNANQKSADNYAIYEFGIDELTRWNKLNGTGASAAFPMEWLAEQMNLIDPDDLYPHFALLWTYLEMPTPTLRERANTLMDKLIPISEKRQLWDQYGHMMSLKIFFLTDFNEIVKLYEPNVKKLAKSPQGAGALAMLSQVYGEKLGNSEKAAKYMKMAEDADPKRVELPKWIE
ncbi:MULTISPECIES: energy transducer TonB [Bacteroidales]|jgi:TonB family protein|uniref:Energy transducer TonB n=1 Tax=Duncaniella freteri TaxID=2530391 RepID=A0A4Z0V7M3_9BACT|nr:MULTISPECIES: energy transducer TonB [Bacteroidales]TGG40781.1 energy transducer TonB [Duncaniella freteri]